MHNLHDHHPPVRLDTELKGILHGKPIDQTLLQTPDLPALIVLAEGERLDLSDQAGQAYFYAHLDGLDVAWQGVALGPDAYAQGPIALRGPVPVVSDRDANGHLFGALVFLPAFLIFAGTALGLAYVLESAQQTPPWLGVAIIAGCLIAMACAFGTLFALERVVRGYVYSRSRTTTLAHRLSKPIQVSFPAGFAPASADSPTIPSLSPQTLVVGFFETIKDHTPTHAYHMGRRWNCLKAPSCASPTDPQTPCSGTIAPPPRPPSPDHWCTKAGTPTQQAPFWSTTTNTTATSWG